MAIKDDKLHLLIVDDEADIRDILQFNLENEGYEVDMAESAEQALETLSDKHKLIILDVMMGGMSGFRMAERLRKSGNDTPIIFITAKDTENDMLTGFSIGADDYISKPFSIKEVIARVRSIVKRTYKPDAAASNSTIEVNTLLVDLDKKEVLIDDNIIDLTKTEYGILLLLLENQNRIFSREDILNKVWTDGEIVLERTVDVHIARLRKKLGNYGDCIVNRTGYGYTFNQGK
ncbi:DNA-binding response regulator [Dysgonomonas sp. 216]|uniref:response regulator transcription factor n=1 Tax=Dysgonomonas sp. 216 TaxID=2302934 RepID=UPI0013D8BC52|nr:response regulator transcription factor [Dysgonomonas sp. 216]NDW18536.1 DNA-binding response regulator [Dysgonomonas sp. 216]